MEQDWKATRPIPNAIHSQELLGDVSASNADSNALTQWLQFLLLLWSLTILSGLLRMGNAPATVLVCCDYRNAPHALQCLFFIPVSNLPFGSHTPIRHNFKSRWWLFGVLSLSAESYHPELTFCVGWSSQPLALFFFLFCFVSFCCSNLSVTVSRAGPREKKRARGGTQKFLMFGCLVLRIKTELNFSC